MSDKEDVLKELKAIQSQLYAGLKDIRIAINADKNPEVIAFNFPSKICFSVDGQESLCATSRARRSKKLKRLQQEKLKGQKRC